MAAGKPPRVFVSYAHDSQRHITQVHRFATYLRTQIGLDVHLDLWYDDVRRDWSAWAIDQLDKADFIMVIASPEYRKRAAGLTPPDVGQGSRFEAAIMRDNLTRDMERETERILPVVLPGWSIDDIPRFLNAHSTTRYEIKEFSEDGVAELLAAVTGHGQYPMPERGEWRGGHAPRPNAETTTSVDLAHGFVWVSSDPDIHPGAAWIDGDCYETSIILRPTSFTPNEPGFVELDLGRKYRRLHAVAGVLDDAVESFQVGLFRVYLDGRPRQEYRVAFGKPKKIDVDVTGVLRLRLEMCRPDAGPSPLFSGRHPGGRRPTRLPELAWGNPTLI